MKKLSILLIITLASILVYAQDKPNAKQVVDTLTSPYFWGRGYTNDGLKKAASFLSNEFRSYGLQPLNKGSFLQEFSFPVNTFPGNVEVTLNDVRLVPGKDF